MIQPPRLDYIGDIKKAITLKGVALNFYTFVANSMGSAAMVTRDKTVGNHAIIRVSVTTTLYGDKRGSVAIYWETEVDGAIAGVYICYPDSEGVEYWHTYGINENDYYSWYRYRDWLIYNNKPTLIPTVFDNSSTDKKKQFHNATAGAYWVNARKTQCLTWSDKNVFLAGVNIIRVPDGSIAGAFIRDKKVIIITDGLTASVYKLSTTDYVLENTVTITRLATSANEPAAVCEPNALFLYISTVTTDRVELETFAISSSFEFESKSVESFPFGSGGYGGNASSWSNTANAPNSFVGIYGSVGGAYLVTEDYSGTSSGVDTVTHGASINPNIADPVITATLKTSLEAIDRTWHITPLKDGVKQTELLSSVTATQTGSSSFAADFNEFDTGLGEWIDKPTGGYMPWDGAYWRGVTEDFFIANPHPDAYHGLDGVWWYPDLVPITVRTWTPLYDTQVTNTVTTSGSIAATTIIYCSPADEFIVTSSFNATVSNGVGTSFEVIKATHKSKIVYEHTSEPVPYSGSGGAPFYAENYHAPPLYMGAVFDGEFCFIQITPNRAVLFSIKSGKIKEITTTQSIDRVNLTTL